MHKAIVTPASQQHIAILGSMVIEFRRYNFFYSPGFSTAAGMGKEVTVFYCQLADLLANKHGWTYSTTLSWAHCVLAFFVAVSHYAYGAADPSLSGPLLLQPRWAWP